MVTEKHTSAWEEILMLGDGLIPADRMEYLRQHLQECTECRAQLKNLQRLTTTVHERETKGMLGQKEAPSRDSTRKGRAFASGFTLGNFERFSRLRRYVAAGGLLAIVGLGLLLWSGSVKHGVGPREGMGNAELALRSVSNIASNLQSDEQNAERLAPAAPQQEPMIARSVSLAIVAKDFGEARASLEAILARHQGYAAELTVSTEQNSARSLQASLRIPAGEFVATVTELKALGVVEAESQKGEEVTQQHSDLVARLKNSRETEQRLQAILLQRTGKMSDVLEVEQEISRVRGEIEGMEAEQKALEHRVGFATVDLRIGEEYRAQLGAPSLANRFRNAVVSGFQSAADTIVAVLLWFLNYGPTLVLWLAIFFLPMRFLWRRSKLLMRRDAV